MSAERFEKHYVLTINGWELADEEISIVPGGDWVRFYEVKVYQGSGFGETSEDWILRRTNSIYTAAEANEIETTFPKPSYKIRGSALDALLNRIK